MTEREREREERERERERESPKHGFFSQKTADIRRFALPSPGESSMWRVQEAPKPQIFAENPKIFMENCRKPQIGVCHLRSVTLGAALEVDDLCLKMADGLF